MKRTRIVQLKPGQHRDGAINAQTIVLNGEALAFADTFKDAFHEHYAHIKGILEGYRHPGIAMIAIDDQGVAGSVCVAAKKNQVNVAIIGRHGMADLFLDGDPSLSLRHLVVLIHPQQGNDEPRIRVVDLRTPTAFLDEHGHQMEALEAEGPVLLRVGHFRILCFPTGEDDGLWPDSAEEGWQCVPERVYLSNLPAEPDRWTRKRLHGQSEAESESEESESESESEGTSLEAPIEGRPTDHEVPIAAFNEERNAALSRERSQGRPPTGEIEPEERGVDESDQPSTGGREKARRTIVQSISGPSRARRSLLAEGEAPIGAMRIRSENGKSTIIIGRRAMSEGVLFGRYERCDNEGLKVLSNGRISRVHVLLVEIAGSIYAVDAASTNGMWHEGKERRVLKMKFGSHFMLGDKLATLEWLHAR